MTTFAAILAAIGSFLAKLGAALATILVAKNAGRVGSENEALQEQMDRVREANEARDAADSDDTPDPYLRD